MARMAARGQKARAALEPQTRKLREKHKHNPERLQREMLALYQESETSLFAGCLPMLLQIPFFMVMYHLFSAATMGGTPNDLMVRTLFGTPLSSHFLATGSVVFVENVGNLVCPALFDLGEAARVVIMSVPEGVDKPLKYPHMFQSADLILLNKIDLLPYLDFPMATFTGHVQRVNPRAEVLPVSASLGAGMA
ncbi:YidC/Oxa1 family membrane protein insertase, partial [Kibdelosporangium lantanae]